MRSLNPDQRANLKEQIDEWVEQGVIEPVTSLWTSPLDLRLLNAATVKDAYPLTNI